MELITISDWIALGSALVSLVALVMSFLTDRKAKKLDLLLKQQQLIKQQQEEVENLKADVEVNVVEMPRGQNNKLMFYNKGKSAAYQVNFQLPLDTENNISFLMSDKYLPYPKLMPQQNFEVVYVDFGNTPHQTVEITWDDDFAKNRKKEMVVDM